MKKSPKTATELKHEWDALLNDLRERKEYGAINFVYWITQILRLLIHLEGQRAKD